MAHLSDYSVVEAASWRLASELFRRHPDLWLFRGHPGGGQYDVLWLRRPQRQSGPGDVRLNRAAGTIQVLETFDGSPALYQPTDWTTYLAADPRQFLAALERAAGLSPPPQVPSATPVSLTYRVIAQVTAMQAKSVHPVQVEEGYIDTSGDGGGTNTEMFSRFPEIPDELATSRPDDPFGEAGYRFWFLLRDGKPFAALEQSEGLVWARSDELSLPALYADCGRDIVRTAARVVDRSW